MYLKKNLWKTFWISYNLFEPFFLLAEILLLYNISWHEIELEIVFRKYIKLLLNNMRDLP